MRHCIVGDIHGEYKTLLNLIDKAIPIVMFFVGYGFAAFNNRRKHPTNTTFGGKKYGK